MGIKWLLPAAAVALAACGVAGQPRSATYPRPSPTASAVSAPSPTAGLLVIASGLPGIQQVSNPPTGQAMVSIVDAEGQVRARAMFEPPPAPRIGNAGALLQSPVRAAAGAAYYADKSGSVRKLTPDGTVSPVAKFPLTNPQQELTYAVSPDGAHLIAIVLSTPPLHDPPPQSLADPLYQEGAHWKLRLETAEAGGPTATTLERDLGTAFPRPTLIAGWDERGPVASLNSALGAQSVPASTRFFGDSIVHLASDGSHAEQLGGPGCVAVDEIPNGTVVCAADTSPQLRVKSSSGAVFWQASLPAGASSASPWLSPDGSTIALQGLTVTARGAAPAPAAAIPLGWLDNSTIVESTAAGDLSLYEAAGGKKLRDLGLNGIFAGKT